MSRMSVPGKRNTDHRKRGADRLIWLKSGSRSSATGVSLLSCWLGPGSVRFGVGGRGEYCGLHHLSQRLEGPRNASPAGHWSQ